MKNLKKLAFILSLLVLAAGASNIYPTMKFVQIESYNFTPDQKQKPIIQPKDLEKPKNPSVFKEVAGAIWDYKISLATILSSGYLTHLGKINAKTNSQLSKAARSTRNGLLLLLPTIALSERIKQLINGPLHYLNEYYIYNTKMMRLGTLGMGLVGSLICMANLTTLLKHTPKLLRHYKIMK